MQIQILASGSSGNAALLRDDDTTVLLDAGISMRRVRLGLESMGMGFDDLDAIVVTHDHSDHIKGLKMIRKYHGHIPIHASRGTSDALQMGRKQRIVTPGTPLEIGRITCHPYRVSHDAAEPLGYRFETASGHRVGWATDLGEWDDEVVEHLTGCHMVMIESNHDVRMLASGPYPYFLKQRVRSARGHLSNAQARALLEQVVGPELEFVALGHLSSSNNDPEVAYGTVSQALEGSEVHLMVAPRKEPSRLVSLPGDHAPCVPTPPRAPTPPLQTSLF